MNNKIVAQKLRFLNLRIEILKNRFEDIINTKSVKDYGGFKVGMFSFCFDDMNPFKNEKISDELRDFICNNFSIASDEYHIEYHLENICYGVLPYFQNLIHGEFEINDEIIRINISKLASTMKSMNILISKLENKHLTEVKNEHRK